jgi:hypothetical protein
MQDFKLNDKIEWESTSGGVTKKKEGVIVVVIPAHTDLFKIPYDSKKELKKAFEYLNSFNKSKLSTGMSRKEKSYVVLVDSKYLYWPIAKKLKKAE